MAKYPRINRGIGSLTPEMWTRLMRLLQEDEESAVSQPRNAAYHSNHRELRRKIPSNIVRIKNENSSAKIVRGEAVVVTGSVLETNLAACVSCSGGDCAYGTCGSWPDSYGDIRGAAFNNLMTFKVKTIRPSAKAFVPLPENKQRWFVSASDIPAGGYGWAYVSGAHWAWVWDPVGLLEMGTGSFQDNEWLYVDLPDPTFEDGETDENLTTYAAYNAADQWQVYGTNSVNSPLMVRPQGSARVLFADTTDQLFAASLTGGGAGDGNTKWPISQQDCNALGFDITPKIRLALIERCGWTVPCLPAQITNGYKRTISGHEQDNVYEYTWYHRTGKEDYELGSNSTRRAYNLAESNNCLCTTAACEECCAEANDSCKRVAGFPIPKLVECFGACGWMMQPIGGWSCTPTATANGQSVHMHMTIDSTGLQRPTFSLQNPITSDC